MAKGIGSYWRSYKDYLAGEHGSQRTLLCQGYGGQAKESCRLSTHYSILVPYVNDYL